MKKSNMITAQFTLFSLLVLGCTPALALETDKNMIKKQISQASSDDNSRYLYAYNDEQIPAEQLPESEYEDVPVYEEQGEYEQTEDTYIEGEYEEGVEYIEQGDSYETEEEYEIVYIEGECPEGEECEDVIVEYEEYEGESYPEGAHDAEIEYSEEKEEAGH